MTHTYEPDAEYPLTLLAPKACFVLDAGHGGTSLDPEYKALARYEIGTSTQQDEGTLKTVWRYPKPPGDVSWARYYGRGAAFLSERVVVLEVASRIEAELARRIHGSKLGSHLSVQLTRLSDVITTVSARRQMTRDAVSRELHEPSSVPLDFAAPPGKHHWVAFLSLHVEGSAPHGQTGSLFYHRRGQAERQAAYIDELEAAIRRGAGANPQLGVMGARRSCATVGGLTVLDHDALNIWASLVELEALSCTAGYSHLRDPTFLAALAFALADGLWTFVMKLYAEAMFITDPHQRDACKGVGKEMEQVTGA